MVRAPLHANLLLPIHKTSSPPRPLYGLPPRPWRSVLLSHFLVLGRQSSPYVLSGPLLRHHHRHPCHQRMITSEVVEEELREFAISLVQYAEDQWCNGVFSKQDWYCLISMFWWCQQQTMAMKEPTGKNVKTLAKLGKSKYPTFVSCLCLAIGCFTFRWLWWHPGRVPVIFQEPRNLWCHRILHPFRLEVVSIF